MSQFLVEAVADAMEELKEVGEDEDRLDRAVETLGGEITEGLDKIKRLVVVDQKPIGRTPRSNLATYPGLFDHVRKLLAATKQATPRYRIAVFDSDVRCIRSAKCLD